MSPELLKNNSHYTKLLTIVGKSEWRLFITTFIRRKNPITGIYWFYLLAGLAAVLYLFFTNELYNVSSRYWIVGLTGGLVVSLLISPVLHEFIHSIFFKVNGAGGIKFKWNSQLLRFKIRSTDFVLSKRKYYSICCFTFSLFSIMPLILAFFSRGVLLFTLISISFFHALYIMKDLAVCSYLYKFANSFIYGSEENETTFYKALA